MIVRNRSQLFFFVILLLVFLVVGTAAAITDVTGPEISDVRIEENGKTLTVGDTIHLSAKISDPSGVSGAYTILSASVSGGASIVMKLEYNSTNDRWEGAHLITEEDKDGIYHIDYLNASDNYRNSGYYNDYIQYPEYLNTVTIEGAQNDTDGPEISDVRIEENGRTLTVGDTIHLSAKITDPSGVSGAYTILSASVSGGASIVMKLEYNSTNDRWEGAHLITEEDKDGTYHIDYLNASDNYRNSGYYNDYEYYPNYRNLVTIFTGTNPILPKQVNALIVNLDQDGNRIKPSDFTYEPVNMTVVVKTPDGEFASELYLEPYKFSDSRILTQLSFPGDIPDFEPGKYEIEIRDLTEFVRYRRSPNIRMFLSANGWINSDNIIEINLIWTDDSSSENANVQIVHALPEDEIGAYAIGPDGSKQYLIFQTYDICMAYLGSSELCSGNERCYHK